MKDVLKNISEAAFKDELQKIAAGIPNVPSISRTVESRFVAAHEAAQKAAKKVAQTKPPVKPM